MVQNTRTRAVPIRSYLSAVRAMQGGATTHMLQDTRVPTLSIRCIRVLPSSPAKLPVGPGLLNLTP